MHSSQRNCPSVVVFRSLAEYSPLCALRTIASLIFRENSDFCTRFKFVFELLDDIRTLSIAFFERFNWEAFERSDFTAS